MAFILSNYGLVVELVKARSNGDADILRLVEKVLASAALRQETELSWFRYEGGGRNALSRELIDNIYEEFVLTHNEWQSLWGVLTGQQQGSLKEHWIPETLHVLSPVGLARPKVDLVPAIRKVGSGNWSDGDFSGAGLVKRLMELERPTLEKLDERDLFRKINNFLRDVTGAKDATITIPHDAGTILVDMDNRTLPLTSLGTGVHEVVILAAAATVLRDQVVCIEEPELHVHPQLQKELLRYLGEQTNNQYFISTHSAHLLDTQGAAVFHVRLVGGRSSVEAVTTDAEKARICAELGYRASDLLQANSVIWVEGPSDRIYLNYWIHALAPDLVDGLHYSIMFYGGRLLSHLTADDPEVEDFISLRRLNRNIAIVIDSDRSKARGRINDTKQRVKREFDKGPGFAWVTKGREIENYIDPTVLEEAVKEAHRNVVGLKNVGEYEDRMWFKAKGERKLRRADKVKVAREVVRHGPSLEVLDLKQMVRKVVQFVQTANEPEEA